MYTKNIRKATSKDIERFKNLSRVRRGGKGKFRKFDEQLSKCEAIEIGFNHGVVLEFIDSIEVRRFRSALAKLNRDDLVWMFRTLRDGDDLYVYKDVKKAKA